MPVAARATPGGARPEGVVDRAFAVVAIERPAHAGVSENGIAGCDPVGNFMVATCPRDGTDGWWRIDMLGTGLLGLVGVAVTRRRGRTP